MRSAGRAVAAVAVVVLGLVALPPATRPVAAVPELVAFPGAVGFGAGATGGRGGEVVVVDTLEPFGPGSLGAALAPETCGPRIVVFRVSGVIEVPGDHGLDLTCGDLTVAGQTAPGAGITVAGRIDGYGADPAGNIVLRHLRIRPPPISDEEGLEDDLGHRYDALQLSNNPELMLDHLTMSWGSDETFDIYEGSGDVTLQWSTIEQSNPEGLGPDGPHNDAMIAGPDSPRVTVDHVLMAHHEARCPALATGPAQLTNSVVYDCQDALVHHNPAEGELQIAGNTFVHGPSHEEFSPLFIDDEEPGGTTYWIGENTFRAVDGTELTVEGIEDTPHAEAAFSSGADPSQLIEAPTDLTTASDAYQPFDVESPDRAYADVLAGAGAFPRDAMTEETVADVEAGTGDWTPDPPDDLFAGLEPTAPPVDDDGDGMADEWEEANGVEDPTEVMASGYTAIEEHVNEQADQLVAGTGAPTGASSGPSAGPPSPASGVAGDDDGSDGWSKIAVAGTLLVVLVVAIAVLAFAFRPGRTRSR